MNVAALKLSTLEEIETLGAIRSTMHTVCENRRLLLKIVLAGKMHWMNSARRAFKGLACDDGTFERMWVYFVHKAGPGDKQHMKAELGLLLEYQAAQQAQQESADEIIRFDGAVMDVMGKPH